MGTSTEERREYYLAHKEHENATTRAYYLRHRKGLLAKARAWRQQNPDKVKHRNNSPLRAFSARELWHLRKVTVLLHYSNPRDVTPICNGCGEQDLDVLCIDHIYGGGTLEYWRVRA